MSGADRGGRHVSLSGATTGGSEVLTSAARGPGWGPYCCCVLCGGYTTLSPSQTNRLVSSVLII